MNNNFQKTLNRTISSCLILVLFLTTILGEPSFIYAASEPSALAFSGISFTQLPSKIGVLKEYEPALPGQPFVVHIQSAHANPDAQASIRKILHWLKENQKQNTLHVGLEGSVGVIHPEYFDLAPKLPALGEAVLEDLHRKGEVTGAELFAWDIYKAANKSKQPSAGIKLEGIESLALYRDNLLSYKNIISRDGEAQAMVGPLKKDLELAKSRFLSPELKDFYREKDRRKNGRFDQSAGAGSLPQMDVYLRYLAARVLQVRGIDLSDPIEQIRFPIYARVLALERLSKSLDSKMAKREEAEVIKAVQKRARAAKDKDLVVSLSQLAALRQPRFVVENLFVFAGQHHMDLKKYPNYLNVLGQGILKSEIDSEELFSEMDRLEGLLVERLARTAEEKSVAALIEDLDLLEKITALKLTREDYVRAGTKRFTSLAPAQLQRRLGRLLDRKTTPILDAKIFNDAFNFYHDAEARDRALVENMMSLRSSDQALRVLVSGGFHTQGMLEILREKGIGYAVIQPRIQKAEKDLNLKVFKEEHADLSAYFPNHPLNGQEAILLKQLLETALPAAVEKLGVSYELLASLAAQIINSHPVLSRQIFATLETSSASAVMSLQFEPNINVQNEGGAQLEANAVEMALKSTQADLYPELSPVPNYFASQVRGGDGASVLSFEPTGGLKITATRQALKPRTEYFSRSETRATDGEITRGAAIFEGRVTTDPVRRIVRPSQEADLNQSLISNFSAEERDRLKSIAIRELAKGQTAFSTAAAGASSRMPISEAPETIQALSEKIHGSGHQLESKAAVPMGEFEETAYSYLGLMLADIRELESEIGHAIPGAKANHVLIMTNLDYQDELDNELQRNDFYGIPEDRFVRHHGRIGYQQELGPKYYLNETDAAKVLKTILDKKTKTPEERAAMTQKLQPLYEATLQKAQEVREAIKSGRPEAVVHPAERDPAGHLEFLTQMVSKGILLDLIDSGVKQITFRNIDNAAATFTEEFLVILGYMLDKNLDAVFEVSRRGPGMKGGGWLIDEKGNHQIAEDPTIDATWKLILDEFAAQGWKREVELQKTEAGNSIETIPASVFEEMKAVLQAGKIIPIEPSRLSFIQERVNSQAELSTLVSNGNDALIAVFRDGQGALRVIRKVTSADTSAINNAVAILGVGYIIDVFRTPGQTREEFIEEMRTAQAAGNLEVIAERGRINSPLLLDPKPSRDTTVLGLTKAEGNMWQTTGILPETTKVEAVVVKSTRDIDAAQYDSAKTFEVQAELLTDFRFLATKQWEGPAESYTANLKYYEPLFHRIFKQRRFDSTTLQNRSENRQALGLRIGVIGVNSKPYQVTEAALADYGHEVNILESKESNLSQEKLINLFKDQDVVVISSQLTEGLSYREQKERLIELANRLGQALRSAREQGVLGRKVVILRDHMGIGSSSEFYRILKRQFPEQRAYRRDFDVVYQPHFDIRGKGGENIEKVAVFGLRDAGTEAKKRDRKATADILSKLYSSDQMRIHMINIRSAEAAYEMFLVWSDKRLAHFRDAAALAEKIGADIYEVAFGVGLDKRIGFRHINPTLAVGGRLALLREWIIESRLDEVSGLMIEPNPGEDYASQLRNIREQLKKRLGQAAREIAFLEEETADQRFHEILNSLSSNPEIQSRLYFPLLLTVIEFINQRALQDSLRTIIKLLGPGNPSDKTVAILGVGFSEQGAQITRSPALALIVGLVNKGVRDFRISDPLTREAFQKWIQDMRQIDSRFQSVRFAGMEKDDKPLSIFEAIHGPKGPADVTLVVQEAHPDLKSLNLDELAEALDGKPFYDAIGLFGRRADGSGPVYSFENLKQLKKKINLVALGRPDYSQLVDSRLYNSIEDLEAEGIKPGVNKKVTVIAAGYVGLVWASKLAQLGYEVTVYEIDLKKVAMLSKPADEIEMPIYEPGLKERIQQAIRDGNFKVTADPQIAFSEAEYIFAAVGTPQKDNGEADLRYLESAAKTAADVLKQRFEQQPASAIIPFTVKSTIPSDGVHLVQRVFEEKGLGQQVVAASNPEFFKEGSALADVDHPDRTHIGVTNPVARRLLLELFYPLMKESPHPILVTSPESSTTTKYVANAHLAIDITTAFLISNEAALHKADYNEVITVLRDLDEIGPAAFIREGCWGGSCFPKDTRAISTYAKQKTGKNLPLVEFTDKMNTRNKTAIIDRVQTLLEERDLTLEDQVGTFFGLTFKDLTDDVRETPAAFAAYNALARGARQIRIHDPIFSDPDAPPSDRVWANFLYEVFKVARKDAVFSFEFDNFKNQIKVKPFLLQDSFLKAFFKEARFLESYQASLRHFLKKDTDDFKDTYGIFFQKEKPADPWKAPYVGAEESLTLKEHLKLFAARVSDAESEFNALQKAFFYEIFLKDLERGGRDRLILVTNLEESVAPYGADQRDASRFIVLVTDWKFYRNVPFDQLVEASNGSLIGVVDTRGIWHARAQAGEFSDLGLDYYSNRIAPILSVRSENRHRVSPILNGLQRLTIPTSSLRNRIAQLPDGTVDFRKSLTGNSVFGKASRIASVFGEDDQAGYLPLRYPIDLSPSALKFWFTPVMSAEESTNPIFELARQHLGDDGLKLLKASAAAMPIHPIVPVEDSNLEQLPIGAVAYLALAGKNDPITFVVQKSEEEATALHKKFVTRYSFLGDLAKNIQVVGVGHEGNNVIEEAKRLVAADRTRVVGVIHADSNLLAEHFSAVKRERAPEGVPAHPYRLIGDSEELKKQSSYPLAGLALRNPVTDSFEIRLNQFAERSGIPNFAQKVENWLRAIQTFSVNA